LGLRAACPFISVAFHPVELRQTSRVLPQPLSISKKSPSIVQQMRTPKPTTARETTTATPKSTRETCL